MSRAPHNELHDFDSILGWRDPVTPARLSRAAIFSIGFHVVALLIFLVLPRSEYKFRDSVHVTFDPKQAVVIYAPRMRELTQKDPNIGKVTNELDVNSTPQARPAPRSFQVPAPPGPANRPPTPTPALSAPNVDVVLDAPDLGALAGTRTLPQAPNQPKLTIENVAPAPTGLPTPNPALRAPKSSVGDVAKMTKQPGGGGGGVLSDGDNGDPTSIGNMQLLSDPQNIDFRPYMQQVLALVRRQWFAVIPQIARTGRQGIVVLQFSIDRRGQVPKLVIANTSGTVAFDQAAVASVSASNPFPSLPNDYRGTEIRLQLAFSYNVPRAR